MNMAEAKAELMKLANGKYHSMDYSINDNGKGHNSQECTVYIEDIGSFKAAYWETALNDMRSAVSGAPKISEDLPLSKAKSI